MDEGRKDDDFFDLCEKYLDLIETRDRVLAQSGASVETPIDDMLVDQIDDFDAQQRILMWRILCSGEPSEGTGAREQPRLQAGDGEIREPAEAKNTESARTERETGGNARGRFALRELAGLLRGPFKKSGSRFR